VPSAPRASGLVAAGGAACLFAVNGTVSKLVLADGGLSSAALVQLRSAGAALCLMATVAVVRRDALRVGARELGFLAVAGVVGIGLVQWTYFVAIDRLPVGIALLLEFLAPLLVALWVRFVRREPVRPRVWLALALCVTGLAVVAQVWAGATLDGVGVLAGLAAAASLAVYYLTGERGLERRDALSLAAWTFTAAAVFWSIVRPWWGFPGEALADPVALPGPLPAWSAPTWVLVVAIVLAGTVVPFALVLIALRQLGPTRTGLVGTAEPVLAGIVAWVVLDESLEAVQLVGAAVVLAGIAVAETARRRPDDAAEPLPGGLAP
jgi:drug/metabolite transporter (DMT)-like permease